MKNRFPLLIGLSALSLLITSCGSKSSTFKTEVKVKMDAGMNSEKTSYDLKMDYDDDYFLKDAKAYNKDLALLSFASSLASKTPSRGNEFFKTIEFKDVTTKNYDSTSEDGSAYILAHKSLKKYELVSIAIRGFDYQKEWANNLKLGISGDHEGFTQSSNDIYKELQSYISSYANNKPLKLWINGYSRGGALSNVLSSIIIRNKQIDVSLENMFVYTFESPRGLTKENAIEYESIHNIVNSCDLITNIAPEKYELYRCGKDVDIYNSDVSGIVYNFDKNIIIPSLVTAASYNNDTQLVSYIINGVVNNSGISDDRSANDRVHFANNYQNGFSYLTGLIFSLKGTTRTKMISSLKNMGSSVLPMISDETGSQLSSFLKTYLNADAVIYDETLLLSSSAVACKAFKSIGSHIISIFTNANSNMTRLLDMHYPEVAYALLLNSH